MKFGMSLPGIMPQTGVGWSDSQVAEGVAAVAKKAEALGYDYVSCCDHPIIPKQDADTIGTRWFDPIATLGYAAGMTERIKLMSSVIVLPYRKPFEVAKAFGTLDSLSGGRVILGVGVGHLKSEFEVLGANYAERGAVSDEYLQIIKVLWTDEPASYHGRFWDFDDVVISPRPVSDPHPPIWIGGNAKAAVKRAVLYGQGWHPMQLSLEDYRVRIAYARSLMAKAGRTEPFVFNARIDGICPTHVVGGTAPPGPVGEDSGGNAPYHVHVSAAGRNVPDLTTSEQVCNLVQSYTDAGANMVNLGFRYQELASLLESMEWAAEEVMVRFA